jgi:formylglycine-generating enzyme required for sulfatase activity
LSVKNGVVRQGGTIISYISNRSSEDEAIIYEHDRFHLGDQSVGNKPVVRVTFHGAHLYAASHGKNLLSDEEWRFAYRFHAGNTKSDSAESNRTEKESVLTMMHDTPIAPSQESDIMTLDDMGKELKEWVSMSADPAEGTKTASDTTYEAGVIDVEKLAPDKFPSRRTPWEGFDDVGFRTKIPIIIEQ